VTHTDNTVQFHLYTAQHQTSNITVYWQTASSLNAQLMHNSSRKHA